ncbi:hypothetical protein ACFO8Q_01010 [Effusibacillus consociatus]|uniref:Uncharacterized protein n=2 Tax=Effusibacillus consociatus TaxID=1117041 RepID=A0ABV9Q000_9BACL
MNGFYFLFVSLGFGYAGIMRGAITSLSFLVTGIMLVSILLLCIRIVIKKSENVRKEPKALFLLTCATFLFQVIIGVMNEMQRGKAFFDSLLDQFSFASYGVYIGLLAAAGLLFSDIAIQTMNKKMEK